jgi:hypothetical protein
MSVLVYTGEVTGQVEAQVNGQVASPVTGQSESRPEWFSKGGRTFLSANKNRMAGWKTRPPLRPADKVLKKILEKDGV